MLARQTSISSATRTGWSTLVALLLATVATGAEVDFAGTTTTVTGFGTVGGVFTSNGNFAYSLDGPAGKGASNQIDTALDSRLGVQASVNFGSGLSITAQEVVKERGNDAFSPGTEWFFGQYSPTTRLDLRVGRVALDTFLISDSLNVGYASTWFQPPATVYGTEPFKFIDGVQAFYRFNLGPVNVKLEGATGSIGADFNTTALGAKVEAKYAYNVQATLLYKNFLLNLADTYNSSPFSLSLGPRSVETSLQDTFRVVGAQYDDGRAILQAEFIRRTQNFIPVLEIPFAEFKSGYLACGWHVRELTPMVMVGVFNPSTSLLTPAGHHTQVSAVLRYDVARNVALKAQVDRAPVSEFTSFTNPDFSSNLRVNVFSFGADFIF